jgi:hypothetical protein
MLPFSREQFIAIFADYNAGVWPAQVVAYLLGLFIVVLLVRPFRDGGRILGAALAVMWIWTGIVYHGLYFSAINKAALGFAVFFVLQGIALVYASATQRLDASHERGRAAWLGWGFLIYALVVYPAIGMAFGHRYPEMPMFGITPCPVTIFSFGVLLLVRPGVPWWVLMIPLVWSLIGGSAAFLLGVPQDWLLLLSGVVFVPTILRRGAGMVSPARASGRSLSNRTK